MLKRIAGSKVPEKQPLSQYHDGTFMIGFAYIIAVYRYEVHVYAIFYWLALHGTIPLLPFVGLKYDLAPAVDYLHLVGTYIHTLRTKLIIHIEGGLRSKDVRYINNWILVQAYHRRTG